MTQEKQTKKKCETCWYWDLKGVQAHDMDPTYAQMLMDEKRGFCKKRAPESNFPGWPLVNCNEWCSQWRWVKEKPLELRFVPDDLFQPKKVLTPQPA